MASGRRVSIVLGAGGARGYAHIGAIAVLAERGYEVVAVAGCSMGALVGGIFAAGELDGFAKWALGLHQRDVARLVDVASPTEPGVVRARRVVDRVRELVGERRIEDLALPFTAVATDLLARREVWFQRGPLDVAIRASIAMPGIFTPVMVDGRLLADGGLLEPLPVAPTAAVPDDLTVAVALDGGRQASGPVAVDEAEGPDVLPTGLGKFDVMTYALQAMQDVIGRVRLASFPPDVLVEVPRDACGTLDFHRAETMIELGRTLTVKALDEFEAGPTSTPAPADA